MEKKNQGHQFKFFRECRDRGRERGQHGVILAEEVGQCFQWKKVLYLPSPSF